MGALVYFDTDTFRHFSATYQERPLPSDLRDRIVLSPITMLEVFSQMAEGCAESLYKQLQGLPNWINRNDVHLLPWPDEEISDLLFDVPPKDDSFMLSVQGIVQQCLNGEDVTESACELRDATRKFKERYANNFQALINICRDDPSVTKDFSEEWLRLRVKEYTGNRQSELLKALGAYHEFDLQKLKVALDNPDYSPQKHQNDVLDCEQLAYLCDPALQFIPCDKGYLNKVKKSPQKNRIHQTSPETLSDSARAEALLRQISDCSAASA